MEMLIGVFLVCIGVAYWTYQLIRLEPIRCEKCGEKMKLDSIDDPTGFNVSKKITFSFWTGPAKLKKVYKCSSCGTTAVKSVWEL